jgi:hypothetical protein
MLSKVLIAALCLITLGCSSLDYSRCISESRRSVIISWGDYDMKNSKVIHGYAVTTEMKVYNLASLRDSTVGEPALMTTDSVYCEMTEKLWETILEVQTLNVPADTVRFIRYSNPKNNVSVNGLWNNKLKAIGSKEYREVFSILNTISPVKFEE